MGCDLRRPTGAFLLALVTACGGSSGAGTSAGATDSATEGTSQGSAGASSGAASTGTASATSSSSTASTSASGTVGSTGGGSGGSSTTTGGGGSSGCGMPAPATGTTADLEVDVDGSTRQYDLFVPSGYDADVPTALVLNFHGLMGSPAGQADFSQFNVTAEARGLLVAYPRGIGQSFNAGACCGEAASQGIDDVGFARALVAQLAAQHCVDQRRVYVTGMSNGGHMAHTLACEAADVFAAAAPVSGVLGIPCRPARPISVLDFHGTGDLIVPYGGAGPGFPPVDTMMADWAARNGCASPSEVTVSVGDAVCETWPACTDGVEVTLCTLGAGHCWPGGGTCLFGTKSDAISASEMMADLFASQLLP